MTNLIKQRLKVLYDFQQKYPTSHVGGSIGLMLRGIDLQRDLSKSDLDITIDEIDSKSISECYDERSDASDFDFSVKKDFGSGYVKIDIRVSPEPSFDIIEYKGSNYNVSKLRDILFWKEKYAKRHIKHKDDLDTIKTGIRPIRIPKAKRRNIRKDTEKGLK